MTRKPRRNHVRILIYRAWAIIWPEKTANIWRRYHWFPRRTTSEKQVQKFHADDASLPRSRQWFRLVESNFSRGMTNLKHYPDLGSDASSVWNFCARFSDVIWRGYQWQRRQMSAVFSGQLLVRLCCILNLSGHTSSCTG